MLTGQRRSFNVVLHVLVPLAVAVAVGFVVYHNVIPMPHARSASRCR